METESFIDTSQEYSSVQKSSRPGGRRDKVLIGLLCVNAVLMLTVMAFHRYLAKIFIPSIAERTAACFEDTLMDTPIHTQTKTFNTTVDPDIGVVVDMVFPSTWSTNADWDSIIDVGRIWLTKDEVSRIPSGNVQLYESGNGYAGNLEVFHELHCLNRIRRRFYNLEVQHGTESDDYRDAHDRHCFHYLWQTLMCHADLSVMSLVWQQKDGSRTAYFSSTKQCRSFEQIHDWAKARSLE